MENFGFGEPSIYQILYEHLDERGYLPRDFSLRAVLAENDDADGTAVLFSDGFMEGNLTGSDKGEERSAALQTITRQVMEGQYQKAADGLKAFFAPEESHLMNQYVLPLQEWIYEKRNDFDPERLVWFAVHLLQEADNVEIIKYALTLLEFYDFHEDGEIAPMLRLLAQCNEFTLFCLRDFSVWHWKKSLGRHNWCTAGAGFLPWKCWSPKPQRFATGCCSTAGTTTSIRNIPPFSLPRRWILRGCCGSRK